MQQQADPLAQLRDIHQPGMIETWPPAPGWWILAGLALLALIALVTWLFLHWRRNRYRRVLLRCRSFCSCYDDFFQFSLVSKSKTYRRREEAR